MIEEIKSDRDFIEKNPYSRISQKQINKKINLIDEKEYYQDNFSQKESIKKLRKSYNSCDNVLNYKCIKNQLDKNHQHSDDKSISLKEKKYSMSNITDEKNEKKWFKLIEKKQNRKLNKSSKNILVPLDDFNFFEKIPNQHDIDQIKSQNEENSPKMQSEEGKYLSK